MKDIIILNGSGRKNGSTSKLINAFTEGAKNAGNNVQEFFLQNMNIHGCLNCGGCKRNGNPCIQKDDMERIYESFKTADIVVFASPIYFWTITGTLKTATDRLYALFNKFGMENFKKESILILTAGAPYFDQPGDPVEWYRGFSKQIGWNSLGEILGAEKIEEAKKLGESIK